MKPVNLEETATATFDLGDLAAQLEAEDAFEASRHTAGTLVKGDDLRVILAVASEGSQLREHAAPNPAIVVVLTGEVVFRFFETGEETTLSAGQAVAFGGGVRHVVDATEDARFLIVIGGHRPATWPEEE